MAEMKTVRALRNGFYIGRRRAGEQFQVPKEMSHSWFEEVVAPVPPALKKSKTITLPHKGKDIEESPLID